MAVYDLAVGILDPRQQGRKKLLKCWSDEELQRVAYKKPDGKAKVRERLGGYAADNRYAR
jgi:hypothetical protein